MLRVRLIGLLLVAQVLGTAATAVAQGDASCQPPCRRGFYCRDGQCVSACNPPCPTGQVCVDNDCLAVPMAATAPATQVALPRPGAPCPGAAGAAPVPAAGDLAFTRGYFSLGAIVSFQSWAHFNDGYDQRDHSASVGGGVQLAGYWVAIRFLHVGGYFSYAGATWDHMGESAMGLFGAVGPSSAPGKSYGLGLSVKVGKRLAERIWLGPALDLGLAVDSFDINENSVVHPESRMTRYGLQAFPRAQLDVVLARLQGGVRLSAWTALGSRVTQYLNLNRGWAADLELLIGMAVGR